MLQNQISTSDRQSFICNSYFTKVQSHPINADIGNDACQAVQNAINSHSDKEVKWMRNERNGENSFIWAIEFFSDKSKTSLGAGSLKFYPLNITALNFIESGRGKPGSKNRKLVADLPVCFMQTRGDDRLQITKAGREKF